MDITWEDYLERLLSEAPELSCINISPIGDSHFSSKLAAASVLLGEQFIKTSTHPRNLFILPDFKYSFPSFLFLYVLHAIVSDRIKSSYNQSKFKAGDILKVGRAYVKFLGKANEKDEFVKLQFADTIISKKIRDLPHFQKGKIGTIKLSTYSKYCKELANKHSTDIYLTSRPALELATSLKTHLDGSILVITSRNAVKSSFLKYALDRVPVTELFLMGEAKLRYSSGAIDVENINTGKLSGTPAIIFAYDTYVASELLRTKENKIKSIIIDNSEFSNKLEYSFFDLVDSNIPVTCISNYATATDLSIYLEQNYNAWFWTNALLTSSLEPYSLMPTPCALNEVQFTSIESRNLDQILLHLKQVNKDALTRELLDVYSRLISTFWKVLRLVTPWDKQELSSSKKFLNQHRDKLESGKKCIDSNTYAQLDFIISQLLAIHTDTEIPPKVREIDSLLSNNSRKSIVIVVDPKCDKKKVSRYWYNRINRTQPWSNITIEFASEYSKLDCYYDLTIVCGWFKEKIMQDVLMNLKSQSCVVLMYGSETVWKNFYFSNWASKLKNANSNIELINKCFNKQHSQVVLPADIDLITETNTGFIADSPLGSSQTRNNFASVPLPSFDELEILRRQAEYQALSGFSSDDSEEIITTIPVDFCESAIAYFRVNHKVTCVTDILQKRSQEVQNLKPSELRHGDFVAFRMTDKNQVRDLADSALQGNSYRDRANLWKKALNHALATASEESLYSAMRIYGYAKSKQTFTQWLSNDDMIGPQDKNDLKILAKATKCPELTNHLDECWDAIRLVRSTHAKAGNYLSNIMEEKLPAILAEQGPINLNDFNRILTINIPDVGPVKILKVLDFGDEIDVRISCADRLLNV